jgi:Uma2 family endonuclease
MEVKLMTPPTLFPIPLNGLEQMSEEEFFAFCQRNADLRIEREANKQITIMSPAGANSGRFSSEVNGQLYMWNVQQGKGYTFDSSTGFTLPDGSVKSPDAAWVGRERWEALSEAEQNKFAPLAPDFVAEVVSLSDSLPAVKDKMKHFIEQGVRLAFLIIPHLQQAFIYRATGTVELVEDFSGKISGESVLPGFQLDLSRLR